MQHQKWVKHGLLYLPRSLVSHLSTGPKLPVLEAITAEMVLGYKGTEQKAIEISQNIYWRDCILLASRISSILEKHGVENTDIQLKLSRHIFSKNSIDRITRLLILPKGLTRNSLFNYWQLLLFIKIVLLYGSDDRSLGLSDHNRMNSIGECFLVINDLLDQCSYKSNVHDDTYLN
jgi:hypothetical protein